jgi:uncharacterized protein DUF732
METTVSSRRQAEWEQFCGARPAGTRWRRACHDMRMRRLLTVCCITATLGLAAPAQADPGVDASFLDALTRAGITFSDGPGAVSAARTACGLMDNGQPGLDIVQRVAEQNPGISPTSAAKFTAIAASAYCPQYLQRVSGPGAGAAQPSGTPPSGRQ